jgi:hypothetical protein
MQTHRVERLEPFPAGAPIVWRSRLRDGIGFVFACRVLADDNEVVAVVQPTGAAISRRVGRRGGPRGRSMLPDGWDGSRTISVWEQAPAVRLHPLGRSYSVIRTWLEAERRFHGWYVNLEQPWVRAAVGFDSRDNVLDVTVADDLSRCVLKDEDELDFAVEVGKLTATEARSIRSTAESAIDDVTRRNWPFDDVAWHAFQPLPDDQPPDLPAGWDNP